MGVDGLQGEGGGGWRREGTRLARRVQVRSIDLGGGTRLGFSERAPLRTRPLGWATAIGDRCAGGRERAVRGSVGRGRKGGAPSQRGRPAGALRAELAWFGFGFGFGLGLGLGLVLVLGLGLGLGLGLRIPRCRSRAAVAATAADGTTGGGAATAAEGGAAEGGAVAGGAAGGVTAGGSAGEGGAAAAAPSRSMGSESSVEIKAR